MKKAKHTIAVLGAGNFGTAFAQVLGQNGHRVNLWNWEEDLLPIRQIKKYRENKKYLKGVKLSENIYPTESAVDALQNAQFIFFAVPSAYVRNTIHYISTLIQDNAILIDLSKGIELHSLELIPHILAKHVRPKLKKNIVTISGPSVASQMAAGNVTFMNIASKNAAAMKKVINIVENKAIHLVPTNDVVGVELGGSFKNVYAIGMGMCDGLDIALNTKAALITYAIEEIADLAKAMGGKRKTIYDLAGLGDLIGTALCEDSRNRRFGEYMAQGLSHTQALKKTGQIVEGIDAARCLMSLKKKYKLDLPFTEMIYSCITGKGTASVATRYERFLNRL
jgi:glycerol-3-phosphate dehydrogenase (NAD(P)+)